MAATNTSLLTNNPTEGAVVVGLIGGGTTAQRPTNAPLYFNYFDTDLQQTVVWNGTIWVPSQQGSIGNQGPQGAPGPQGPPGSSGSGVVQWAAILNKPALFDIVGDNLFGGLNGGYIQYDDGFQLTWFQGNSSSSEGIYTRSLPVGAYTVPGNPALGTILAVYVSTGLSTASFGSTADSFFQVLGWDNFNIIYGMQNANTGSGLIPATPTFLVISFNPPPP